MIIDLKYHIASLVAVFLALGIGIFVGSALIGNDVNDVIVNQQNKMYEDLSKNLNKLRIDNRAARNEINSYKNSLEAERQFEKAVLPVLVSGKLQGKKIAVIENEISGLNEGWIETLKNAGGQITSITTILKDFNLADEDKRNAVATKLMINPDSEEQVIREVALEIAAGIKSGQNLENIRYFENHGMIKMSGEYGIPFDYVVVAGGSDLNSKEQCKNLDLPMIRYFVDNKIPVSGVEKSNVKVSYMKMYQQLEIATVDNIDMASGQLSLVMALTGETGDYGIKKTARQLIPAIP